MQKETFGKVTLYCGDCMELMAGLDDKEFDLAVVDPPYGIGESGKTNKTRGKLAVAKDYKPFAGGDLSAPPVEYFSEITRLSRNQIVWGANHFIDRIGKGSPCWIVWDKLNGGSDFADCELAYSSFKTAVRKFSFQWAGMLQGDMKNKEIRIHPTQKPVKLYDWILSNYAKPEHLILDTHLGSGSSAIAGYYFGCEFVGIELDQEYFDAACKRVEQATKQESLF